MRTIAKISRFFVWITIATVASAAPPQYQIFDLGVTQVGDTAAQGFNASPGGVAVGRSVRSGGSQAFTWTVGGGLVGLPNLSGRPYAVSNDANDSGIVVGTGATTLFGSSRLPVIWNNGVVSQLPLPAGETLGDANGVNASGIAVGSVDAGSFQQGVIYNGANATVITQTTSTGCFFVTAFGINDSGRIVGQGIDPNNAARNVGIVYDMGNASAFEVGALPGANGALAFAVGNGGHVVGSSMMNQGSGLPFIWSSATGMVAIPLATGTSQGSARGVNTAGWVVGQDSSAFSIPFLWDGTTTYRLADLLPAGSGWDLSMNTSSSALGISDSGVIVGTGVHNGDIHAYAMVPVQGTPTPSPTATSTPSPTPTPTPKPTPAPTPTPPMTDYGIAMTDSPDPVQVGQHLTYTITASRLGPDPGVYNVIVTDTLPPGVEYVSATPSQGNCTGTSNITCNLGVFFTNATVTLVVTPTATGQLSNTAHVSSMGDPNSSNDSFTVMTTVIPGATPTPSPTPSATATVTPTPTPSPTPTSSPTKALNLATRLRVQTGNNVGIGGFIITGNASKNVAIRGIGPSLSAFGITDALVDPTLELRDSNGGLLKGNDDWQDNAPDAAQLTSLGLAPQNSKESGLVATLQPGASYTAILAGKNQGVGVGLVEIYDVGQGSDSQLANISTRSFVLTGSNVTIAGFILGGNNNTGIVVRGLGPSLAQFGLSPVLADPTLELHDSNGATVVSNDNWGDDAASAAQLIARGLAPANVKEAAFFASLPPGAFTAILAGANSGTGIGLVEIYNVH